MILTTMCPLLDCRLDGEMGDAFSWYLSFATDITADTIESVQRHIRKAVLFAGQCLGSAAPSADRRRLSGGQLQ